MFRFLAGIITALMVIWAIQYFTDKSKQKDEIQFNSALLEQQIKQVGKLIVTEGQFSQVLSYKNTKKNYFDIFSANKKALVIVNAKVTVAYDLRQIKTEIDQENKQVIILEVPEPEINIYPDLKYYDISQDYFNKFDAADYNKIKGSVDKMIQTKVDQSDLKANAKERLINELSKIYILTNSLGWSLQYQEMTINSPTDLDNLKF
ncbi:DUF4230 domain-containing protein [Cyclobacterium marinum]|uniref:DUF4230 domain-containing protein n=1 Tax=Cyclobacterium marinum (strain ATCC 25205 / DSM 745 / LMG 13164 / NCIMB 1802) TaxID=880070 RepID=G0J022_CYCMS|nr:DUF4230 domain-containing protein [Cyclobacterium marinum]AEL27283.1 hypothetical protein Cycma_3563 [Cyclobacterium marinum DSM 745]MBI0400526.1 DUF4230 domain-containing protein [Cyclobacterium marinum]MBR9774635.1 DUF4230 domain-containing protein [Cytophagales bacterium]|tara:strand:+ start:48559 stop:49173 length:615 start_codon:yes stop_codon:yes gene_type:complete